MTAPDALARFLDLLRIAVEQQSLVKLTLGRPAAGADPTLRNLFVRPVTLKSGPHLSFIWRHATQDITKNLPPAEALAEVGRLLPAVFTDAHLFTPIQTAQLQTHADGRVKLRVHTAVDAPPPPPEAHDREKSRILPADAPWLRALGVTNDRGQPREGMAAKFRQIQKFAELLLHDVEAAGLGEDRTLRVADMGAGKGYLTFAAAALLGPRATVIGVERRADLVDTCNRVAREHGLEHLSFKQGDIDATPAGHLDVLIALHACDTATDDALAAGIAAGAQLLVVSPCCQKELRAQLTAPTVLAPALRHGIFQERQAEFATDALRALLLEWAGYETKVFEFVSTEHTAKNLMITAIRSAEAPPPGNPAAAARLRAFAAFYGLRDQRLARHLGLSLNT